MRIRKLAIAFLVLIGLSIWTAYILMPAAWAGDLEQALGEEWTKAVGGICLVVWGLWVRKARRGWRRQAKKPAYVIRKRRAFKL